MEKGDYAGDPLLIGVCFAVFDLNIDVLIVSTAYP